jgi:hypothetical protein
MEFSTLHYRIFRVWVKSLTGDQAKFYPKPWQFGFDLRTLSDLLNTGETPEQKVRSQRSFEPELSLPLVQSCVSSEYLMKVIFAKAWAVAVVMG